VSYPNCSEFPLPSFLPRIGVRDDGSGIQKVTTAKFTGAKNQCPMHPLVGISLFVIAIAIVIGIDPISRAFLPHRMPYPFDFDSDHDFDLDYPKG